VLFIGVKSALSSKWLLLYKYKNRIHNILTLIITLAKASIGLSHNKAFYTHCDKNCCCLIILNKIAIPYFGRNINLRPAHIVYLCVLCGFEEKKRLFPYTALKCQM
jgi:hypothetical protein